MLFFKIIFCSEVVVMIEIGILRIIQYEGKTVELISCGVFHNSAIDKDYIE